MRYFLQFFGIFWLALTLPVVGMGFSQRSPQVNSWVLVVLALVAVVPGLYALARSKRYPEKDEYFKKEIVQQGSVIGGSIRLAKMIRRDPRGFWEALRW